MPGIKELKNKIKSVKSTRKITKAMQMVSAAKMRKSQTAALNSRKYSDMAWALINSLSPMISKSEGNDDVLDTDSTQEKISESAIALTKVFPNATKTGIIIISTNKGLVGSFNTNLVNKLREVEKGDIIAELVVMGKKVKEAAIRTNRNLIADFTKKDNWTPIEGIYPVAKTVTDLYLSGQYKQILVIYNHFVSTLTQKPTVKQLLPFVNNNEQVASSREHGEYLFEPTPELVLNHLIPRIIESQIYQAVLESDASEHSARMVMMKNATEAAGDLIDDYTLTYNQLRQNKITTELAEITAGKIALE